MEIFVPTLDKIGKALADAQAEMTNPKFDRENPHFRNKFASLAAVRDAVVPALAKHGVSVTQDLVTQENQVGCVTIFTHASGQQMRFGPLFLPATKADAQGLGSAATYARRYALMAACGVVGDEDDDANEATGKPAPSAGITRPGGTSIHDPKGDLGKNVPTDKAVALADRMREAMQQDKEEPAIAGDVFAIHDDIKTDHNLYVAASRLLQAKERRAWKAYVSMHSRPNGAQ